MLFLSLVLATAPFVAAPQGGPGPVAHWIAPVGNTPGISGLIGAWTTTNPAGITLTAKSMTSWPRLDQKLAAGQPALVFDGQDGLNAPSGMPVGSTSRAVAFRVDAVDDAAVVFGGELADSLYVRPGTHELVFAQGGAELGTGAPLSLGEFHLAIATWDASTGQAELYLDNALVASGTLPPLGTFGLGVGGSQYGGHGLEGAIAEVYLFDHVLTDNERTLVGQSLAEYLLPSFPKVELTALPRDAQILQRDSSNTAVARVEGVVETPGYDQARLRVERDGAVVSTRTVPLAYGAEGAPFTLSATLEAGLYNHTLRVILLKGTQATVIAERYNVAVGDNFLVDGQSNAVAKDWHAEGLGDQNQSHWVRSFGDATWVQAIVPPPFAYGGFYLVIDKAEHSRDANWDMARSLVPHSHATIGQWALRMANLLVEMEGVPIGVINGGSEGSSILWHQRNDYNPTDPAGIYGRILHRAQLAEVADSVRAVIYYQGEVDGPIPGLWAWGFDEMWADWHIDYPALEKVYVMQIREGCNIENDGVREIQRTLGDVYPDVAVMSTTALPTHDNCHYYYLGYAKLGERMARLIGRDLYGVNAVGVDPPNVVSATWEGPTQEALILQFEPTDSSVIPDEGVEKYLSVNDGTVVTQVNALPGARLRLGLAGSSTATAVTWRGHIYDGPWLQNVQGVGALTFFDFPITP